MRKAKLHNCLQVHLLHGAMTVILATVHVRGNTLNPCCTRPPAKRCLCHCLRARQLQQQATQSPTYTIPLSPSSDDGLKIQICLGAVPKNHQLLVAWVVDKVPKRITFTDAVNAFTPERCAVRTPTPGSLLLNVNSIETMRKTMCRGKARVWSMHTILHRGIPAAVHIFTSGNHHEPTDCLSDGSDPVRASYVTKQSVRYGTCTIQISNLQCTPTDEGTLWVLQGQSMHVRSITTVPQHS